MGLEHWRDIVNVNLWGVIHGTTTAYQVMVRQGFGHIVNIASMAGLVPVPMETAYVTTKYGVVGLSLSLRAEAGQLGVKVSVVCPGFVRTGIYEAASVLKVSREELIDIFKEAVDTQSPARQAEIKSRAIEWEKLAVFEEGT